MPTASPPTRSRRNSPSTAPTRRRRRRPSPTPRRWPTASCWRATSSTSRPTSSGRSSSPPQAKALEKLGVEVEILTEKEMKKLGMGALLGVAQGSPRGAAPGRHAVERRQGQGQAGRLRRQGRHLRHRRQLDEAGRRHGGHEGRHGRRRRRDRPDARARRAQGQGQCRRHHRPGRERRRRQCAASGRHRHLDVGPDDRGAEHRRRRPPRACRCALVLQPALRAEIHGQPGDADRRDHGRARPEPCRPVLQQ